MSECKFGGEVSESTCILVREQVNECRTVHAILLHEKAPFVFRISTVMASIRKFSERRKPRKSVAKLLKTVTRTAVLI